MDNQTQQVLNGLFQKLGQAEAQSGPREPAAEALIRDAVAAQPGAPYYMAQTILVQEQALESLNQRVQELEQAQAAQASQAPAQGGGFLGGLFGGGRKSAAPPPPSQAAYPPGGATGQAMRQAPQGSFLGGAMQTAMGVAGGVMLANAVTGMFAGDEAQAAEAEPAPEEPAAADEAPADDWGMDAGGFDDEF